jgi:hypothetical protein
VQRLLNQAPEPDSGIAALAEARPVLVACLWERDGAQVKEHAPAVVTHRSAAAALCHFWDARMEEAVSYWVDLQFVSERPFFETGGF